MVLLAAYFFGIIFHVSNIFLTFRAINEDAFQMGTPFFFFKHKFAKCHATLR